MQNRYSSHPYQSPWNRPNYFPYSAYEPPYKLQHSRTHFVMGLAAGASIAYLLTNEKFKRSISGLGGRLWSNVNSEVEELKERLEDTQAELDYYRKIHPTGE